MTRAHVGALFFGAAAALGLVGRTAQALAAVPLRVGVVAAESSAEVYYAQQLGTFTKNGLEVDIQPFQSTPAAVSALVSGALDIAFGTVPTTALAHAKGLPGVLIAPGAMITAAQPPTELFVRSDSPIRVAADFVGKTVAVPGLTTMNEYGARAWTDRNGGDSTKARFVELAFPLMPAALGAGRVDVASITEPFVALAKQMGHRVLANPNLAIGSDFLGTGYLATAQWASGHADLVTRFASAIRETAIWANENPNKTVAMLAQFSKVDPAVIASMVRARYAERLTAAMVQPVVDVAARYSGFTSFSGAELIYEAPR
jgi:NitT/TauT family transport system substrate-binding protein